MGLFYCVCNTITPLYVVLKKQYICIPTSCHPKAGITIADTSILFIMQNCLNYNCNDTLDTHEPVDCGDYPLGGIDAAIILTCDSQLTDPSDGAEILVEINAGRAFLVENIKVSVPEASPILVPNPVACKTDRLINYDRSLVWMDSNVNPENISWYTTLLSGQSFGGLIYRECGTGRVSFIDEEITWSGSRVVPESDNEHQMFSATAAWRSKVEPEIFDEPANIFTT